MKEVKGGNTRAEGKDRKGRRRRKQERRKGGRTTKERIGEKMDEDAERKDKGREMDGGKDKEEGNKR